MSQRLGNRKKRQRGLLPFQVALRERIDLVSDMITGNTKQTVEKVTYGALKVYPDEKLRKQGDI
jgi:hypothetical protein